MGECVDAWMGKLNKPNKLNEPNKPINPYTHMPVYQNLGKNDKISQ
jgi:hypothetical protein